MAKDQIYVAKTSAVLKYNGRRIVLRKGVTTVRAGHPIMEGREDLFKPLDVQFDVEQATAAPGEKRSLSTGRRKAAAPTAAADEESTD